MRTKRRGTNMKIDQLYEQPARQYDTGRHKWTYGLITGWYENGQPKKWMLGPCPLCGYPTWNSGLTYICINSDCVRHSSQPGKIPDWWGKDMVVKIDGSAWCAHGNDFIDLQSSIAGFGNTPAEAVGDYIAARLKQLTDY